MTGFDITGEDFHAIGSCELGDTDLKQDIRPPSDWHPVPLPSSS